MIAIPKIAKRLADNGPLVGRGVVRVDGPAKVTGAAKYAAEHFTPGLTYGYVVLSEIARGRITSIDSSKALEIPEVLAIFTHENRPRTAWFDRKWKDDDAVAGSPFRPLHDAEIHFAMQPVALVVAETFEAARAAARLVDIEYEETVHQTNLRENLADARLPRGGKGGFTPPPKPRGDADAAFAAAPVQIDVEFHQPVEHHNPMEMHASTVIYEDDDSLTIYDKTQGCQNSQRYVTNVFGLPAARVRVKSPFVGGGFGSGLRPQFQLFLATMAALQLKRSVRLVLTRPDMFTFGHRPETIQKLKLAATPDGKLQAIIHEAFAETSRFEDYCEVVVNWSGQSYQCDNVRLDYNVVPLDQYTPLDMRAPGAVTGVFALECAMDELATKLKIDPLQLRLINYAEQDQNFQKPFSSKELRACYEQGAERFGWANRSTEPGQMRDGKHRIGYGMAGGVWDALSGPADAKAKLTIDGKLVVASATADIGTGTYTVMSQIAAEATGLPLSDVEFKLGDSSMPTAPLEGGSWTVASVGPAVKAACDGIAQKLFKLAAGMKNSPLGSAKLADVEFVGGQIRLKGTPSAAVSISDAMRAGDVLTLEESVKSIPNLLKQRKYTMSTHCCTFVEVRVDEEMGTVGVSRVVSAVAAGRIINPKTAASQVRGAVVWGIGMAMQEETLHDHKLGRFMNHDFAEYHVPVNADVPDIEVIFVEEKDDIVNSLGAKGVGEIGLVGVAAAIANAVYNATGRRIRELPITVDKLL